MKKYTSQDEKKLTEKLFRGSDVQVIDANTRGIGTFRIFTCVAPEI